MQGDINYESGLKPEDRLSQANAMMHIQQIGEDYALDNSLIAERCCSIPVDGDESEISGDLPSPVKDSSQMTLEEPNENTNVEGFHKNIYVNQVAQVDIVNEIEKDTH